MTEGPDVPFEMTEDSLNIPCIHEALRDSLDAVHEAQERVAMALRIVPDGDMSRSLLLYAQKKLDDAEIDIECPLRIITVMKEDGVSYEEAWRLVGEEPKYSLGWWWYP